MKELSDYIKQHKTNIKIFKYSSIFSVFLILLSFFVKEQLVYLILLIPMLLIFLYGIKVEKARLKEDQKALTDLLLKENDYKIKTD